LRLGQKYSYSKEPAEAQELAESIAASIPFHVTESLQVLMSKAESGTGTVNFGRSIGGLLLMHLLYVMSKISIVSAELRAHMRVWLAWIGRYMGIGEATVLSNVSP
jgi:hypothetical protein